MNRRGRMTADSTRNSTRDSSSTAIAIDVVQIPLLSSFSRQTDPHPSIHKQTPMLSVIYSRSAALAILTSLPLAAVLLFLVLSGNAGRLPLTKSASMSAASSLTRRRTCGLSWALRLLSGSLSLVLPGEYTSLEPRSLVLPCDSLEYAQRTSLGTLVV